MAERLRLSRSDPHSKFPGILISNLVLTEDKLGKGADATVYAVEWNGTVCAAKRLHDILLEDESPGGADKLISNFEAECLTWSKLRHPGVVQFLGVHIDRRSRLPVLVMEKMDTSLRTYLEHHSKEEFSLHQKTFVLRQVTQALGYLHSQNPPLVHHDLSPNNVLLNVVSFVTKVSDFGMSRAINPSALSRKSSIKGTLAFMAPEALQTPPRYNEKLDMFSFGNVILHILTHEWPNPGPPTKYEGDVFVGLTEFQRRKQCVELFTPQEKQLFLPIVRQCLENRPDKRPSSVMLVQELRRIESTLPKGGHFAVTIEHLQRQLSAKEEECRQKDEVIREKDEALKEKDIVIREKDEALKEKGIVMTTQADNQQLRSQNSVDGGRTIPAQQSEIQCLRDQLAWSKQVTTVRTKCYQAQSRHTIGKEEDRISVPICISDSVHPFWIPFLKNGIAQINNACPGVHLFLATQSNSKVIVRGCPERSFYTQGNILSDTASQVVTISLCNTCKCSDWYMKQTSVHELLHALGVEYEHQAADADKHNKCPTEDSHYSQLQDVVHITAPMDPYSIMMHPEGRRKYTARGEGDKLLQKEGSDPVWSLKKPGKRNIKISELDKVCLNQIYRPCRSATYNPVRSSVTGMWYCGRRVMQNHNHPAASITDGHCGPDNWANCPACRSLKNPVVDEFLHKGCWQGWSGLVYCGRHFGKQGPGHDGCCGPNNGQPCPQCASILRKK